MTAYWIAHVTVTDAERYKAYQALAPVSFARFGGQFLARGGEADVMEGPAMARHVVIDMEAASPYVLGDRVFHQKFGYGEIMGIEGDKLDIEFDHAGSKKVVARWVIPADQVDDVPF